MIVPSHFQKKYIRLNTNTPIAIFLYKNIFILLKQIYQNVEQVLRWYIGDKCRLSWQH